MQQRQEVDDSIGEELNKRLFFLKSLTGKNTILNASD